MNKTTVSKIFSTSLSLALIATSAPVPAGALGPVDAAGPAFVAQLTPPERFGYVASSYAPNGESKPRLIVISDLHGHIQVQKNIMGILEKLVGQLYTGKKVPILLEGGWTPNLEEPLHNVTNPKVRAFLDEYLLHKAELSAGQAFSEKIAGSGQVSLIGVENEMEYKRNKEVFVKTYPVRKKLLVALRREELALAKLSGQVSNRSFLSLQTMRNDYYAGKIQPEKFARALVHQAARLGIDGKYIEVLKNASTARPDDLDVAFSEVYQAVSQSVSNSRPLTAFLRQSLENENGIRQNIALIDGRLDLLKRLVGDQLTPSEVPLVMARMSELVQVAEILVPPSSVNMNVGDVVRDSLNFYPYAIMRDESLVKNSLAAIDKMGSDTTGVLIVGGFHAEAIDQYLRDHHVAYMQINPTITRDLTADEELNYIKRVSNDHVTPAELSNDLDSLQNQGGRRLSSAAVGPTTYLEQGNIDPNSKAQEDLANGLTPGQVALITANNDAVTAALGKLDAATAESIATVDQNNEDVQRVLDLANTERVAKGRDPLSTDDFVQTFTLQRLPDGQFAENGNKDSNAAYLINEVMKDIPEAGIAAGSHVQGMNVAIVKSADKLGAGAAVLGAHEEHGNVPLLVLTEAKAEGLLRLRDIKQGLQSGKIKADDPVVNAVMSEMGDLNHEIRGHVFNPTGRVELSALREGTAGAAAMAVRHFTGLPGLGTAEAVLERFLNVEEAKYSDVQVDVNGQAVSAWSAIVPGLAKAISALLAPEELSEAQVQDVIAKVQVKLTNFTPFQVEASIQAQNSRLKNAARAIYYNGEEDKKADEVVEGITQDAKNIETNTVQGENAVKA